MDPCVFLRANSIVLCYVDDCIIIAKENHIIDDLVTSLKNGPEKYYFTVEGTIKNYLGVKIMTHQDWSLEMRQPFLIKKIVDFIEMSNDKNPKDTPVGKQLLQKDLLGLEQKQSWNYRSTVRMLNYL